MRIRTATPDDAGAIAEVHVRSWQGAYRGRLPDEVLDALDVERYRAGWARLLGRPDPSATTLVAEHDRTVVGFAGTARSRDDDAGERTGEVLTIYAVPAAWGTGVGRALMAAGLEALAAAGFDAATLWVLDTNERARRFYERAGFTPDGARKAEVLRGVPVTEVRYRRAVAGSPG